MFKRSVGHLALFVLLTQGSIVVDRLVATLTGVGGVASLDYAHFVTDSVRMLLAVPIATLALGQLGGLKWSEARASVERALTVLLFGALLVSVFAWALSEDIVTVLYRRGEFQEAATALTSGALRGFAIGAWATTTGYVLLRVFNADAAEPRGGDRGGREPGRQRDPRPGPVRSARCVRSRPGHLGVRRSSSWCFSSPGPAPPGP